MSIPLNRYVDITSAIGGGAAIAQRELIGRIYTTDVALTAGQVKEFTSSTAVGAFFGVDSELHRMSQFYFGWISKNVKSPKKLSFARITGTDAATYFASWEGTIDTSNNFGSFVFDSDLRTAVSTFKTALGALIAGYLAENDHLVLGINIENTSAYACTVLLDDTTDTGGLMYFDEMIPMIILAATDYTAYKGTQNYMFQQFDVPATVTSATDADTYDAANTNYMGQTQSAGQTVAFFQRGIMNDGNPINIYANEIWLKSAVATELFNLLMALPQISADDEGEMQIAKSIVSVVDSALNNRTIIVGKDLTNVQKQYIETITADENAWRQVQGLGYWLNVTTSSYTATGGGTEWKAEYTLVYSKSDVVSFVSGSHIMI